MTKQEIQAEIEEFSALLNESSVPQDEKDFAKGEIARLKSELAKLSDKPAKKNPVKTPSKKVKVSVKRPIGVTISDIGPGNKAHNVKHIDSGNKKPTDPDCDDLLKQYDKRRANQKKTARKSASTPTVKKDEKAIKKVATRIVKHYKEGELTVPAIKSLIKELTEKLQELRQLLKSSGKAKKFAGGGGVDGNVDLFDNYEDLPENVRDILNKYSSDDNTYEYLSEMSLELEPLGYAFEFGLDAVPYNLKKIKLKMGGHAGWKHKRKK